MAQHFLSQRQKNMVCEISKGLADETIKANWLYILGQDEKVRIAEADKTGQLWVVRTSNIDMTKSDFDDFIEAGLFKYEGEDKYAFETQKLFDIVKRNFDEDQNNAAVQKIEAVFGEPSTDPDFQCDIFLVMPFRPELDNVYKVLKTIATDLNIVMKRGDEFASFQNVVINDVWSAINRCRLVIADCTAIEKTIGTTIYKEINGNVYYEIGIADALHKPVLLLTRSMDDIPFDLKHRRFVIYQHAYNLYDVLKPTITKMLSISK